jgi:hypothetical protein
MNQVFDLNRWLLLVAKHWNENKKKYLLGMVAVASLLIIWFTFMILAEIQEPLDTTIQSGTYFVGLYLVGCLFASILFADLAGGPKAIHFLSVPASAFEKLLCSLLYGVVFFYIVYTAIFYLVDMPMIKVANAVARNYWEDLRQLSSYKPQDVVNVFIAPGREYTHEPNFFYFFFLGFVALQAAFILGSVYFSGYNFLKTTIALLVVSLFFVFLIVQILNPMMPRGDFNSFTKYRLYENAHYWQVVSLPEWINTTLIFVLKYAFAPVFWVAAYFRLKEKEI